MGWLVKFLRRSNEPSNSWKFLWTLRARCKHKQLHGKILGFRATMLKVVGFFCQAVFQTIYTLSYIELDLEPMLPSLSEYVCSDEEVRVVSEFSGYRTAEIACECVARHLSRHGEEIALTCSSADISKNCQKVISSNSRGLRIPEIAAVSQGSQWLPSSTSSQASRPFFCIV